MINVYMRYRAIVSTQRMSISWPRSQAVNMYKSKTAAMPETIAENMKTIGIMGVDHQGFALMEPKMKPT